MDEDSCCFFLIGGIDCWISHYNFIQYRKEKENLQSQKIYLRVYQFEAGDVEVHYHIQLVENYKNKDYHIATQVIQLQLKGEAYIWGVKMIVPLYRLYPKLLSHFSN